MKAFISGEWFEDFLAGFTAYYLTSLPVLLGGLFWVSILRPVDSSDDLISACFHFDALHYQHILWAGYSYDPARRSTVAFFPAYPLLGRGVKYVLGLPPEEAALLTSHAALLGAFVLLARYVRLRWRQATAGQRAAVLVVFGLWPMGLFFRMPYAESLFVCIALAVLYGMARGWPLMTLALLVGFATATRPVGVALTAAFVWHVLAQPGSRFGTKARRAMLLAPLSCWGLLAYMTYQALAFGNPLAFAQTQENWSMNAPKDRSWSAKLEALAVLEPIWNVYVPSSQRYWGHTHSPDRPLFSLIFWNPILFLLAAMLLGLGGWKRWLTRSELLLGGSLLAIPYLTRSYEMSMASHGRFAAVVVVNYLVIGRVLAHLPSLAVMAVGASLALIIFIFSSLYMANYPIF